MSLAPTSVLEKRGTKRFQKAEDSDGLGQLPMPLILISSQGMSLRREKKANCGRPRRAVQLDGYASSG